MQRFGFAVRLLVLVASSLLVAFAFAGCGDDGDNDNGGGGKTYDQDRPVGEAGKVTVDSKDDFDAGQQAVIDTIAEFADATEAKDYAKICDEILTEKASKIGGGCERVLRRASRDIKEFSITVTSVKVGEDGKTATAEADTETNGQQATPQTLSLVKGAKGEWRVTILGQ